MNTDKLILENFFENHINEAAKTLSSLTIDEIISVIKNLSDEKTYKLFSKIERYKACKILELLDTETSASIIENIPPQIAVIVLRLLELDKLKEILSALPDKQAVQFAAMFLYDEFSVGAVMDPKVFTLTDDKIVKDALEDLKRYDGKIHAQIFVVARDQKLKGVISLHQLIRSNPKDELRSLTDNNVPKIFPEKSIKSLMSHDGWQSYYSLPVTDAENHFLGAISLETVRNFVDNKSNKELKQAVAAGNALGELYRIGLSGLLRSAAEIITKPE